MPDVLSRLRRKYPYLTPPFMPDGEENPCDVFKRKLPVEPTLRRLPAIDPIEASPIPEYDPVPPPRQLGPPPPMIAGRDGRPGAVIGGESDMDRALIRRRALEDYQPKDEDWKHLLARTALGFVGGGIPGAAMTFGLGALDRKAGDRRWQANELGRVDETIGNLRDERRGALQDRLLNAQVNRIENPVADEPTDRVLGNQVIRRLPTGEYQPVYTAPDKPERLLTTRPPILREVLNPDGSKSTKASYDNGQTWQPIEDLTSAAPPQVETPRVDYAPDIKGIEERVKGYQSELAQHQREVATKHGLWKRQAEAKYQAAVQAYNMAIANGERPAKPVRKDFYDAEQANDPHYADGTYEQVNNRIKELQDAIKQETGSLEGLKRENRSMQARPRRTPALTKGLNTTEQKIYEAAKAKNLDPDLAIKRYREGKF